MSLSDILRQPFPHNPSPRNKLEMAAFFGIFIFLFLILFKPFDLDDLSTGRLAFIASMYGLITFGCVFMVTMIVPALFPVALHEDNWTTGKQILLTTGIIFLVGLVNYLVSPLLVESKLTLSNAIWFQGITLAIGILPVSFFILLKQNRLLKKFSGEAEVIEKRLQERQEMITDLEETSQPGLSNKIILEGDYQNERLELYADDLYMITSASNYIKVFHLQKEKLIYSIIRSTLKKAEEIILAHPNFFKCHRAFIINLDKVVHVEGNAQGYKIKLEGYDELVPVSRNLNSEFSDKLLAFRSKMQ